MNSHMSYECSLKGWDVKGRGVLFAQFYESLADEPKQLVTAMVNELRNVDGMSRDGALELVCMILLRLR